MLRQAALLLWELPGALCLSTGAAQLEPASVWAPLVAEQQAALEPVCCCTWVFK